MLIYDFHLCLCSGFNQPVSHLPIMSWPWQFISVLHAVSCVYVTNCYCDEKCGSKNTSFLSLPFISESINCWQIKLCPIVLYTPWLIINNSASRRWEFKPSHDGMSIWQNRGLLALPFLVCTAIGWGGLEPYTECSSAVLLISFPACLQAVVQGRNPTQQSKGYFNSRTTWPSQACLMVYQQF